MVNKTLTILSILFLLLSLIGFYYAFTVTFPVTLTLDYIGRIWMEVFLFTISTVLLIVALTFLLFAIEYDKSLALCQSLCSKVYKHASLIAW